MSTKATHFLDELVVPGKSPPVCRAENKAITTVATDLNATALAEESKFNTDCIAATVDKVAVSENMPAKASKSPGELVVPGKSPPVCTEKDKAIATVATDLNATALAKESSGNTIVLLRRLEKLLSQRMCGQNSVILFGMVHTNVGHKIMLITLSKGYFCTNFYIRWSCDITSLSTSTHTTNKHHHHGDGATRPSSGVDSMNPHRPSGGRPCT